MQEIAISKNAVFIWGHHKVSRLHLSITLSKLFSYRLKLSHQSDTMRLANPNAKIETLLHVDGRAMLMCSLSEEVGSLCLLDILRTVNGRRGSSVSECADESLLC